MTIQIFIQFVSLSHFPASRSEVSNVRQFLSTNGSYDEIGIAVIGFLSLSPIFIVKTWFPE